MTQDGREVSSKKRPSREDWGRRVCIRTYVPIQREAARQHNPPAQKPFRPTGKNADGNVRGPSLTVRSKDAAA
jgi:hypothetical protein